jgi:DNA repair protein RAD51
MEQATKFVPEEDDLGEFCAPTPVTDLEKLGINMADIKKLADAGFSTVQAILFTMKKNLLAVKGMSDAKVDKILDAGKFPLLTW